MEDDEETWNEGVIMSHTEERRDEMRVMVNFLRREIDQFSCTIPESTTQIDWGAAPKGQGKRVGHMVQGSMSGAPRGVKTYYGVDYSEYIEHKEDLKHLRTYELARYIKARKYGLGHWESMYYALT